MPKLSIIVPTFRRPLLLRGAVESILAQDFADYEIIISDDNSSDETDELARELERRDARVRYVLNSRYKQGPNGNKNNGLDHAGGEFVAFLDDDDALLAGALSTLMRKAEEGYAHVMANCVIERDGVRGELSGRGLQEDGELCKKDFLLQKFHGEFFSVFKKSLLQNERFDEEFYGNEATLWVHLYAQRTFYIHKALRIYRVFREDSVTLGAEKNAFRVYLGYLRLAEILEEELEKSGDGDYKRVCASHYKMAAYYAKFARAHKAMLFCLYKSLKTRPNLPAIVLLCLSPLPCSFVKFLSKIRVALCKN